MKPNLQSTNNIIIMKSLIIAALISLISAPVIASPQWSLIDGLTRDGNQLLIDTNSISVGKGEVLFKLKIKNKSGTRSSIAFGVVNGCERILHGTPTWLSSLTGKNGEWISVSINSRASQNLVNKMCWLDYQETVRKQKICNNALFDAQEAKVIARNSDPEKQKDRLLAIEESVISACR